MDVGRLNLSFDGVTTRGSTPRLEGGVHFIDDVGRLNLGFDGVTIRGSTPRLEGGVHFIDDVVSNQVPRSFSPDYYF